MKLPNLFIVGAAKSGTTSLHNYLDQHPDIFMCQPKEPHFLINREIGLSRIPIGISNFKDYQNLFTKGRLCKYRGESSVMYLLYHEIVIPKIQELFGQQTKIIIMLRNPTERAYSGFNHVKRYNMKEDENFETAWEICEERYSADQEMTPASRYKSLGLYYSQVEAYLEAFDNVHIIIYDDYKKDFKLEMKRLFIFLGVDEIQIDAKKRYMQGGWQWKDKRMKYLMTTQNPVKSLFKICFPFNSIRKKIKKIIHNKNKIKVTDMKDRTRDLLTEFYRKDVQKLSQLLNRDLNHWLK